MMKNDIKIHRLYCVLFLDNSVMGSARKISKCKIVIRMCIRRGECMLGKGTYVVSLKLNLEKKIYGLHLYFVAGLKLIY